MTAPQYMPIIGYPKAWTPGTNGVLKGPAVLISARSVADLDKYKGKLKDAIVLIQREQELPISFDPMASRLLETDLQRLMLAPEPGVTAGRRARRCRTRRPASSSSRRRRSCSKPRAPASSSSPAGGSSGRSSSGAAGARMKNAEMPLPAIAVAVEHYNRIVRILQKEHYPGHVGGRGTARSRPTTCRHQRRRRAPWRGQEAQGGDRHAGR